MLVNVVGMKGELSEPKGTPKGDILLLHGTGSDHKHPLLKQLNTAFSDHWCLRADFKFVKSGKISLDQTKEIKEATEHLSFLLRRAGSTPRECIVVGKSFGALITSKLASMYGFKGIVLLGYPLHEENVPTAWFPQEHFAKIKCPVLLIIGEKDKYCNPSMARTLKKKIKKCDLVIVDDADHAFHSKNHEEHENYSYIAEVIKAWQRQL